MASTRANHRNSKRFGFIEKAWPFLFALLLLIATIARFVGITKASIWHDEGFSAMLAGRDWLAIWQGSARDVHPPMYYELLHGWSLIFGSSSLALRSLSAVCGVLVVWLGYLVVQKITKNRAAALLAGLFLALNPFLIRYSQETRMYGVLGVFLLVAMYGLIMMVQDSNDLRGYLLYVVGVSAGLYTHYFTALAVISFWLYAAFIYLRGKKARIDLFIDWRWWVANALALLIFLPWLPNMIKQFTRAQGLGWLSKTSLLSFNDTFWQFFTFTDAHKIWQPAYWLVPILSLAMIIYITIKDKTKQRFSLLLILFTFLPIFMAIGVSFYRPIFHERYFVFSAIGFCMLLAFVVVYITQKNKYLGITLAVLIILIQLVGIRNVNSQASHQMELVVANLNTGFHNGDTIISGELYTYFDGSFYNKTGQAMLLYTGQGRPNGYGESALIYDKNIYLDSYASIGSGRVWVLGKTGQHQYYDDIPASWKLLSEFTRGYSELRLYQIQ